MDGDQLPDRAHEAATGNGLAARPAELLDGKTIDGSGAGDLNFNQQVQLQITERIKLILRRLSQLDPATYQPEDTTPIDRTVIVAPFSLGAGPLQPGLL